MNDVPLVQVFDGAACLYHEAPDLGHGKVLSLLDGVGEGSIFTEFEHDVCALLEGEGPIKLNDVRMGEFGVYLELCYKLQVVSRNRARTTWLGPFARVWEAPSST